MRGYGDHCRLDENNAKLIKVNFHTDCDHELFIELLDVMVELCCIRLFTWS